MTRSRSPHSRSPSAEHRFLAGLRPGFNFTQSVRYPIGPGDDCAARVCSRGETLVFTTDAMVEGTHFSFAWMSPPEIGRKAITVNASDCASMGARPESALIELIMPGRENDERIARQMYRGIGLACRALDCCVIGGNLSRGPCWVVSVTMIGRMPRGIRPMRRNSARVGDTLWVTGVPGESAAGLALLRAYGRKKAQHLAPSLVRRHVNPTARIQTGLALAQAKGVHAMIDISDGVAKEARTVAFESDTGVTLEQNLFTVSPAMLRAAKLLKQDANDWVLGGGEDYELMFAAVSGYDPRPMLSRLNATCTHIGTLTRTARYILHGCDGRPRALGTLGFDHVA